VTEQQMRAWADAYMAALLRKLESEQRGAKR
jgi:hypothetical protein